MGIIWFNVPEAYKYLMENGEVYTLRDHSKKKGNAMLRSSLEGKPYYKGMVTIVFIGEICFTTISPMTLTRSSHLLLKRHVSLSGFSTIWEWLSKLKKLEDRQEYYLYYVRRI